uniref:Metalloendopeptidase n=1 Tax=Parastrongyloides trichosuri TaxID=131310 RepID=A0A0N4ZD33_PARTI
MRRSSMKSLGIFKIESEDEIENHFGDIKIEFDSKEKRQKMIYDKKKFSKGSTRDLERKLFRGSRLILLRNLTKNRKHIFFPKIKILTDPSQASINFDGESSRLKRAVNTLQVATWRFPLLYYVDPDLDAKKIDKAIAIIQSNTCLRFRKSKKLYKRRQGLVFVEYPICGSFIGNYFGKKAQIVAVDKYCNSSVPTIQYLIGYALGMVNQQSRSDRDQYVTINMSHVTPGDEIGFKKYKKSEAESYGLGFDFSSMLMYSPTTFGILGLETVTPIHPAYRNMMGQRYDFSFNDYKLLNLHYCKKKCGKKPIVCDNNGYPDPNDCTRCKCPTGFRGSKCRKLEKSDKECGETEIKAEHVNKDLNLEGAKNCTYLIKTGKGEHLKVTVRRHMTKVYRRCYDKLGLQIKFQKDKGAGGLCLCGFNRDIDIISNSSYLLVQYVGTSETDLAQLRYRIMSD